MLDISHCEAYIWSWLVNGLLKETLSLLHLTFWVCKRFANYHWYYQGDLRTWFGSALYYWVCVCQTELKAGLKNASGRSRTSNNHWMFLLALCCYIRDITLWNHRRHIFSSFLPGSLRSRSLLFWRASGPCDVAHGDLHKPHTQVSYLATTPLQLLHGMMPQ